MKKETIFILVGLIILALAIKPFSLIPEMGLVGEWRFDGNLEDTVGDNDGTNYGATLTEGRFGREDGAYHVNGFSYISLDDVTKLNPQTFSVSFWVKGEPQEWATFVSKGSHVPQGTPGSVNWAILSSNFLSGGDKILFEPYCDKTWGTLQSSTPVLDGEWHHVVVSHSALVSRIYVDGRFDNSAGLCKVLYDDTRSLVVGASAGLIPSPRFNGDIDMVRLYDRVISLSDVGELYEESPPELPEPEPPIIQSSQSSSASLIRRVCYFQEESVCNAEVRVIYEPCPFVSLDECQADLKPKTLIQRIIEWIFGVKENPERFIDQYGREIN